MTPPRPDPYRPALSLEVVGRGVPRLVQTDLTRARHLQSDQASEALVFDARAEFDPLGREFGHGALDVVAHQVQLVMAGRGAAGRVSRIPRRMNTEFGRGQFEDEPAPVGVDIRKAEKVAEEGPRLLGVLGVDD